MHRLRDKTRGFDIVQSVWLKIWLRCDFNRPRSVYNEVWTPNILKFGLRIKELLSCIATTLGLSLTDDFILLVKTTFCHLCQNVVSNFGCALRLAVRSNRHLSTLCMFLCLPKTILRSLILPHSLKYKFLHCILGYRCCRISNMVPSASKISWTAFGQNNYSLQRIPCLERRSSYWYVGMSWEIWLVYPGRCKHIGWSWQATMSVMHLTDCWSTQTRV